MYKTKAGRYLRTPQTSLQRDPNTLSTLDWPDRTVGLGLDWTGLILVRFSLEFWDRTVSQFGLNF